MERIRKPVAKINGCLTNDDIALEKIEQLRKTLEKAKAISEEIALLEIDFEGTIEYLRD